MSILDSEIKKSKDSWITEINSWLITDEEAKSDQDPK
jgi:hypothetical protein